MMIIKLMFRTIYMLALFLCILMFLTTNVMAQGISAPYAYNFWGQTDSWYDAFGRTWSVAEYGSLFSIQPASYQFSSGLWSQYPIQSISYPDTYWTSIFGSLEFDLPNYYSPYGLSYQSRLNINTTSATIPWGCQPLYEKRTCRSRGSCRIPLYCPVILPGLL